jgi:hypothetical protein
LFSRAEIAVMRDRTRSRNYSASRDDFRREHERRRSWGLRRRHAEKLHRLRQDGSGSAVRGGGGACPGASASPRPVALEGRAAPEPVVLEGRAVPEPVTHEGRTVPEPETLLDSVRRPGAGWLPVLAPQRPDVGGGHTPRRLRLGGSGSVVRGAGGAGPEAAAGPRPVTPVKRAESVPEALPMPDRRPGAGQPPVPESPRSGFGEPAWRPRVGQLPAACLPLPGLEVANMVCRPTLRPSAVEGANPLLRPGCVRLLPWRGGRSLPLLVRLVRPWPQEGCPATACPPTACPPTARPRTGRPPAVRPEWSGRQRRASSGHFASGVH